MTGSLIRHHVELPAKERVDFAIVQVPEDAIAITKKCRYDSEQIAFAIVHILVRALTEYLGAEEGKWAGDGDEP